MSITTILIILLVLILVGALPTVGLHQYGYAPSSVLAVVLVVVLILALLGRL